MTGFIKRWFGSKSQNGEKPSSPQPSQPKPQQQRQPKAGDAFFLDPDEAKTLGDIDYMRTARVIKHTFLGGKIVSVEKVSSLEATKLDPSGQDIAAPEAEPSEPAAPSAESSQTSVDRRRNNSDLDPFRSMARDLNKKQS